ncbi:MAG TPA: ABC transporter substrate-binding protein [Acidimicrobiales bacterium]|nr:ABC transporter substrate-binding protein [Acidimicrobiales bacterium]
MSAVNPRSFGRRDALKWGLGGLGAVIVGPVVLAACGDDSGSGAGAADTAVATPPSTAATKAAASGDLQSVITAAQQDGKINLIALPDDWANYKGVLAGFKQTYDIDFNVANPDGSSADEITAVKNLKGQSTQPDAIDVGPSFAIDAAKAGLLAPYQVSLWDEIPDNMKDPDGNWIGAYYGVISFGVNEKNAGGKPTSFAELNDPKYKGKVALNGDPRKANAAFSGVWAASIANGGSLDDISPGIDYFAKLKDAGILIPVDVTPANILNGQVAIAIDWSYNFPAVASKLQDSGVTLDSVVPSDGVYGGFYSQAAVAGSPNPDAAKLWLEWLVSDEGALQYLEGGAFPARYSKLVEAGKVPADVAAKLPDASVMAKVQFATDEQLEKAKATIASDWGPKVAGN